MRSLKTVLNTLMSKVSQRNSDTYKRECGIAATQERMIAFTKRVASEGWQARSESLSNIEARQRIDLKILGMRDNALTRYLTNKARKARSGNPDNIKIFNEAYVEACECCDVFIVRQKYLELTRGPVREAWGIRWIMLRGFLTD